MRIKFHRFIAVLASGLLTVTVGLSQIERSNTSSAKEKEEEKTEGLKLGVEAPDFTLQDRAGEKRSLSDFRGKKRVALVFYPALFRSGG